MSIIDEYRKKVGASESLYKRAVNILPGGVAHDIRILPPFPLYVERAAGSRKWDVEGNEYIDYWMAHGGLMLGHNPPQVIKAVHEELDKGTHFGACHHKEVEWAELIVDMIPSAELVRFTASGTEAVMLALKLARAYTGRDKIIKMEGGFHGWSDYVQFGGGLTPPYDVPPSRGIPQAVRETVLLSPPHDPDFVLNLLRRNQDVAAILLEPGGGLISRGQSSKEYLEQLREMADIYGVVLIFDEVITGFRSAPGGHQEYWDVTPDLTVLGKIVGGGMPGSGAVCGKKEIMSGLAKRGHPEWDRYRRVEHQGTYNAAPPTAAAGVATLKIIKEGQVLPHAHRLGEKLRLGLNQVFMNHGLRCCAYGRASVINLICDHQCDLIDTCDKVACTYDYRLINKVNPAVAANLRYALILQGVDSLAISLLASSAHSEEDIDQTIAAFDYAMDRLKEEDVLQPR